MSYSAALEYLYAIAPPFHQVGAKAYKPGLETMRRLMAAIRNRASEIRNQRSEVGFPVIHVAGTNGKGSTSHLIASCLAAAGYKVGLYTSPHLVSFCERVRVIKKSDAWNKKACFSCIPEDYVADFVEKHKSLIIELQPSFFEITTAMAFCWLREQQVDVAVIEVGLGGMLDSTNIVQPLLAVITNIGLDHTDLLGNTLAAIAEQKAGIMKLGVPCVVGETHRETEQVFINHARACNILGEGLETTDCRLWFADQCGFMRRQRLRQAPVCQLKGEYQDKNMQTAYVALQVLRNYCEISKKQSVISNAAIAEGFANVVSYTGLRGRWEILAEHPLTICDTGHNSHGVATYVQQLLHITHQTSNVTHLHIVFGMVADKDVDEVLRLLPEDATYYFTQPDSHRALPAEEMLAKWRSIHPDSRAQAISTIDDAIRAAQAKTLPGDVIFIGGSNYVVGQAIRLIESASLAD